MHWQKWKGARLAKCFSLMDRVRECSEPRTALIERTFPRESMRSKIIYLRPFQA